MHKQTATFRDQRTPKPNAWGPTHIQTATLGVNSGRKNATVDVSRGRENASFAAMAVQPVKFCHYGRTAFKVLWP